jgi:hypothetical protein
MGGVKDRVERLVGVCLAVLFSAGAVAQTEAPALDASPQVKTGATFVFNPKQDLLSLHYDHAPDKDDGQSAAADRSLLETMFGADWIRGHVVAVSGTYGENRRDFNPDSDAVMDAVWNERGGWLAMHTRRIAALTELTERWAKTLKSGGEVWVKEGGQSDVTFAVVERIKQLLPEVDTTHRIHVVQHADWNEEQTTDAALASTKQHTDYVRIRDANAYLNIAGGDEAFVRAATSHPVFGSAWQAAFAYYDPHERLDFSDTGELMHICGLGELSIDQFRRRFLETAGD